MRLLFTYGLVFFVVSLTAQQNVIRVEDFHTRILERWDILYDAFPENHISAIKNHTRRSAVLAANHIDSMVLLGQKSLYEIAHILIQNDEWKGLKINSSNQQKEFIDSTRVFYGIKENGHIIDHTQILPQIYRSRKPFLNLFYKSPAHFIQVDKPFFTLRANPVISFQYGAERNNGRLFHNLRGVDIRGSVDNKIYFSSRILEAQSVFPEYVDRYINANKALPQNGLYKAYSSDIFKVIGGRDYLNADAFIGFNLTKHVGAQLGYGRHFIGNGIRSLFLSDFSNNYFFLRLNTQVWRFHYQNIFGEINSVSPNFLRGDPLVPKKYFAAHYLGFKVSRNVDIGVFETVVFNREQFEFQYLNPVILYRSVEHHLGSPDNVLLGFDIRWNLWNKASIYGQFVLDEFKFDELFRNNQGWWANKYGIQVGAKYMNAFGLEQLDLQAEFNAVRPYTYSHRDSLSNYAHGFQSLAHPMGANLQEGLFLITYKPHQRVYAEVTIWSALKGLDNNTNWGGNILLPNRTREMDFNNEIAQGLKTKYNMLQLSLSYELFHNGFLDVEIARRNEGEQRSVFFTSGFRMNIGKGQRIF